MRHDALLWLAVVCMALSAARGKTSRTLLTDAQVAAARDKAERFDWARRMRDQAVKQCAWIVAMSDQELWDYVPPPEQRRALNVSFGVGCPVHGKEVFRRGGHYPWILDRERPFKVTCPVGGEVYPSNDFEPWNPGDQPPTSTEAVVDHGTGWLDADGRRYWFVAHYIFWGRWMREVLPGIRDLGTAYLLTGDPQYAHKALIWLARIGADYENYDYHTQAYHNGGYPNHYNGRIIDHIWMNGVVSNCARTYDTIFPTIAEDADVAAFLAGKGIDDVVRHLDQKLLGQMANDIMSGVIRGNNGMHQYALANAAIALDNDDPAYGPTTAEMRDWLMSGGEIEQLLWNGFYRDGHGGESSPGYSSGWNVGFYNTAELLPWLGVNIWSNPKLKKMADIGIELTIAGGFTPSIGDSGSILGSKRVGWSTSLQGPAFRHYADPWHAKVLHLLGVRTETLFDEPIDEQVAAVVAQHGTDLGLSTRSLGGYGLAVLEGGRGDNRRGLSIYYGHAGGGHGHRDRLTIELFAFGRPMLTDMGYPAHWLAKNSLWTSNTVSHYCVVVDERGQETLYRGHLRSLGSTVDTQFAEVDADRSAYPGRATLYRRASALMDLDEENGYLLDVFRVVGGRTHDWSFHGPPFPDVSVKGMSLTAQTQGTLAGETIPFGQAVSVREASHGELLELKSFDGVLNDRRPYAERSLEGWAGYATNYVLTRASGAVISTTATRLPTGKVNLFLRAYDYNSGHNRIEVTVGDQTATFEWGEGGQIGYVWLPPQAIELSRSDAVVTVKAREQGQNYILLDLLAATTQDEPPAISDRSRSGYQYLYNVRRGHPEGAWSATWSDAEEDLHLTCTVPDGSADEVIVADAEPELKPHMPEKLTYLLAHNEAAGDEPLASTFVAVVEPHRGPARVTSVRRLKLLRGPAQAVALAIEHAGGTDLVYNSTEPGVAAEVEWEPGRRLTLGGRFVRATFRGGTLIAASFIDDGRMTGEGIKTHSPRSYSGEVVAVDHAENTVALSGAVDTPDELVGRIAIFENGDNATNYTIRRAEVVGERTVLGFGDTLMLVGMGYATGFDEAARQVRTETKLRGYGRVDGGEHQGRWLLNEAHEYGPKITKVTDSAVETGPFERQLSGFFGDTDGDGRVRFWIADVGPGDLCRIPSASRVEVR